MVILLTITASIYGTGYTRTGITGVERVVRDFVAPVAAGLSRASRAVEGVISTLWNFRTLADENRRLKEQVRDLRIQVAMLEGYRRQNRMLRRALRFQEDHPRELLTAEVIGREPVSWYSYILINRGSRDGVRPGMAVVSPGGVVGQVRTVTAHSAEVMLILDSRSAIGGRVKRSGELVLVEGQSSSPDQPLVRSLVRDSDLQEGDEVVTSGLSQTFPGGLVLGTIVEVKTDPYGINKTGVLRPGVDFSQLEVVFVLLRGTSDS